MIEWAKKHPNLAFSIVLAGLLDLQYGPSIVRGEPVLGLDAVWQFEPWLRFASEALHNGELPLWDPYTFSGHPFLANPQVGLFYPGNWAYFLLPSTLTLQLIAISHIFLFGLFAFWFGKEIGLSEFPSAIAALVLSFSEYTAARLWAGHLDVLATVAWLPLLFLIILRLSKGSSLKLFVLGILCTAMILLAGFLQVAYHIFFAAGLFSLYLLLFEVPSERRPRLAVSYLLLIAGGLALSTIQLLPTWELLQHSSRSDGVSFIYAAQQSLPPWFLITMIAPDFFLTAGSTNLDPVSSSEILKSEVALNIGAVPLVLALFAIATRRFDKRVVFFTLLAAFFAILSMGKYTPLYDLFFKIVPGYSRFRIPAHHWVIVLFSLSLLVGFGVEHLWQEREKVKTLYKATIALLVSLEAVVVLGFVFRGSVLGTATAESSSRSPSDASSMPSTGQSIQLLYDSAGKSLWLPMFLLAGFCLWWFIFFRLGRREVVAKIALGLLIVGGLFAFNYRFTNQNLSYYQPLISSFTLLEKEFSGQDDRYRVLPMAREFAPPVSWAANALGLEEKVELTLGYDPVILGDYMHYVRLLVGAPEEVISTDDVFTDIARPQLLNLLNVKYVAAGKPVPEDMRSYLDFLGEDNGVWLYRNPQARPRAYLVGTGEVTLVKNQAEAFARLSASPDQSNTIVEADQVQVGNTVQSDGVPINLGETSITDYGNNYVNLSVKASAPGYLVLSDLYYPGWTAYVDGKPTDILRANAIFRAISIQPGEHNVEFRYLPTTFLWGAAISGTTALALLALGIWLLTRRRQKFS